MIPKIGQPLALNAIAPTSNVLNKIKAVGSVKKPRISKIADRARLTKPRIAKPRLKMLHY